MIVVGGLGLGDGLAVVGGLGEAEVDAGGVEVTMLWRGVTSVGRFALSPLLHAAGDTTTTAAATASAKPLVGLLICSPRDHNATVPVGP